MNCAEIRRLPWLIRLLTSVLLAALVLTPAPLALSASRTRPLSMLLLVLTAVLAKVFAPLVQSSRNNHSVPNPLCSVCCAGDFLMQKFIRQHRTIPALRLKHRSGSCGTASAAPRSPYRHLELCGIAIDDLIQALYPAAELFLLLWYRAFALFYTLYGTLTRNPMAANGSAMTKTARWSRDGTPTRTAPTTLTPSPVQWHTARWRSTVRPATSMKQPAS